ncbi:MAG: DUF115 domain-containing protein [Synergistaceae bacterium]|jgi:hypothetical protein|nr:DUF115 domain-containing protein [Synergistaceae bacterium]
MAKELRRAPETLSAWNENMSVLRQRQPALAALLDEYVEKHGHKFNHFETETPKGTWYEGLTSEPFFQSSDEPKFNWNKKDKDKPIFILYGIGAPPYLFDATRVLPRDALGLLVFEPNLSLLAYVLHLMRVYKGLPPACRLLFLSENPRDAGIDGIEDEEERERLKLEAANAQKMLLQEAVGGTLGPAGLFVIVKAMATGHPGEEKIWENFFKDANRRMREWVLMQLQYLGNSPEDSLLGMRQMALMSPWIVYGDKIDSLGDRFKNRPFVCVAAGPSLDKNFHLLKDVQDKCVIVAADAVLEKLLKNGIRPHIVTVLERVVETYNIFFATNVEKYREECENILLVSQAVCIPRISGRWPGPVCIIGKNSVSTDVWLVQDTLGGRLMSSGTSVAHVNYAIASEFGASAVAIIGQDLAYGTDGRSHAGDVGLIEDIPSPDRNPNLFKIPGALGGTVYTSEVWLSFLRLLENNIRQTPHIKSYDCTEGGALILGTRVTPLADFIDEYVKDLDPMELTPAEVVAADRGDSDRVAAADAILVRIEGELDKLDMITEQLKRVEEFVERTGASGLTQNMRLEVSRSAGSLIDRIHNSHATLAFMGQSYTHLASVKLSFVRQLETVEQITQWQALYGEIVEAHNAVVVFMRKWLRYARSAVAHYREHVLEPDPLGSDEALSLAMDLFEEFESAVEEDDFADVRLRFDNLLARCDPTLLEWEGDLMWNLSMLLYEEGRAAEARSYMKCAADFFTGMEMLVSAMAKFYKDYARVLVSRDLCCFPNYQQAEVMLANAVDCGGIDEEANSLLDSIMSGQVGEYEDAQMLGSSKERTEWFRTRAEAQRALYSGDIAKSLDLIWRGVSKYYLSVPGWAMSHIAWLSNAVADCLEAEDRNIAETADRIIDEIAADLNFLRSMRFPYGRKFYDELVRRGVSPNLIMLREEAPTVAPEDENDEEDAPESYAVVDDAVPAGSQA